METRAPPDELPKHGIPPQISGDRVGVSVGVVFGVSGTCSAVTPVVTGYVADLFGLALAFQLLIALAAGAALLSLSLPARGARAVTAAVGARR